jgi:hypothetical protein
MLGELVFECVACLAEALLDGLLEVILDAVFPGSNQDRGAR